MAQRNRIHCGCIVFFISPIAGREKQREGHLPGTGGRRRKYRSQEGELPNQLVYAGMRETKNLMFYQALLWMGKLKKGWNKKETACPVDGRIDPKWGEGTLTSAGLSRYFPPPTTFRILGFILWYFVANMICRRHLLIIAKRRQFFGLFSRILLVADICGNFCKKTLLVAPCSPVLDLCASGRGEPLVATLALVFGVGWGFTEKPVTRNRRRLWWGGNVCVCVYFFVSVFWGEGRNLVWAFDCWGLNNMRIATNVSISECLCVACLVFVYLCFRPVYLCVFHCCRFMGLGDVDVGTVVLLL